MEGMRLGRIGRKLYLAIDESIKVRDEGGEQVLSHVDPDHTPSGRTLHQLLPGEDEVTSRFPSCKYRLRVCIACLFNDTNLGLLELTIRKTKS